MLTYANRIAVFEDNTLNFDYNLQEILLNEEGVKVTSCDDQSTPSKETSKNLLKRDQTANCKWMVPNFNEKKLNNGVWAILEFEKPVLLRGFGLRSANDNPNRDP